jgi:hypothetical protein
MALAFWEFAVAAVQVPLQKKNKGTVDVGIDNGSQSPCKNARPRSSNLIVTGKATPFPIKLTSPSPLKV